MPYQWQVYAFKSPYRKDPLKEFPLEINIVQLIFIWSMYCCIPNTPWLFSFYQRACEGDMKILEHLPGILYASHSDSTMVIIMSSFSIELVIISCVMELQNIENEWEKSQGQNLNFCIMRVLPHQNDIYEKLLIQRTYINLSYAI